MTTTKTTLLTGALLIVACADTASDALQTTGNLGRNAGKQLQDAGAWLADLGDDLHDAGHAIGSDASAQDADAAVESDAATPGAPTAPTAPAIEVVEVACTKTYDWNAFVSEVPLYRQVRLYAVHSIDTSTVKSVSAMRCERETPPACPSNYNCTGQVDPDAYDCEAGIPVQLGTDSLRVLCGEARADGGRALVWSSKFRSVRLRIER